MSNMRQSSGEDYPDAARKHYTDARALLGRRRYDGAAYLAGYAVECILKTIIQMNHPSSVPMIHDINRLSTDAQRLATMPSSRTARYFSPGSPVTRLPYGAPPAGWKETLRYHFSESGLDSFWNIEDLESSDAPHVPVPIRYDEVLADFRNLDDVAGTIVESQDYQSLATRILNRFRGDKR